MIVEDSGYCFGWGRGLGGLFARGHSIGCAGHVEGGGRVGWLIFNRDNKALPVRGFPQKPIFSILASPDSGLVSPVARPQFESTLSVISFPAVMQSWRVVRQFSQSRIFRHWRRK